MSQTPTETSQQIVDRLQPEVDEILQRMGTVDGDKIREYIAAKIAVVEQREAEWQRTIIGAALSGRRGR